MDFSNIKSWGTWTLAIAFIIGGLSAITGLVPANIAVWINTIIAAIGLVTHPIQVNKIGKIVRGMR